MTDAVLRDTLKDVDDDNYLVIVVDEAHVIFKLKQQAIVLARSFKMGGSEFILNASKYMSILDHNTYLKKCIKDEDEAYAHGNGSANEHDNLVVAQHVTQYNYGTYRTKNEWTKQDT
nr:pre-mRNA-splicing factor ATP-dependent RNA helicase DEAH7 [Tanacetum cinerariifolium]